MPTVIFSDRSRVNISNVLALYTYRNAIRVISASVQGEFTLLGPYTHSLAAQFLVNIYPPNLGNGPLFENLYPVNVPTIESIQSQSSRKLSGLGRPFAFSAPCRTPEFIWFLLEGHDFATFQRQARFCQYKPDDKRKLLHVIFNREVFRITPIVKAGQNKADALSELLDQLDIHFPPCDIPSAPDHINTFSVYGGKKGPAKLPLTSPAWANHSRFHVARIEFVDPVSNADEWDEATAAPTQTMTRGKFRKKQEPEFPIQGLEERIVQQPQELMEMGPQGRGLSGL